MKINLKWTEQLGFAFIFIGVITGVAISQIDLKYFESVFVVEDGLIEWLTVLALIAGALTCFYRIKVLAPFRGVLFRVCLFVLGMLFLFGAGEEISWGQRIFDWHVPAFFAKHNSQGETNLHNLVVNGTKINKLVFGLILGICVAIYFLILPFLYKKIDIVKTYVDRLALPIPKNIHIIAYLILFGLTFLVAGGKKGELLEFGGCWIFYLMTLEPYNRELFSRKSLSR